MKRSADRPAAPLTSPMPRSKILDREEPPFVDEGDLPEDARSARAERASSRKPPQAAGAHRDDASVGGEEDPGAAVDAPADDASGRRAGGASGRG
jgi:hypothetical protein